MSENKQGIVQTVRRVLVVEDDIGLRSLIEKTLRRAGYSTEGVSNAAEAMAYVKKSPDTVLLLDQNLPGMSGKDLIIALTDQDFKVPFIVMTGQGDERLAVEMMKLGASDYLVKDIQLIDLLPDLFLRLFHKLDMEHRLHEAERAMARSEERYRKLFDHATEGIFIIDQQGDIVEVNESFARMHGYTVSELLGMNIQALEVEDQSKILPVRIERIMNGESLNFEVDHYHRDGHTFPLDVVANRIELEGKAYVLCFHRDLSERKLAEKDLRNTSERLSMAQEAANMGVWDWNMTNGHIDWSPQMFVIFGIDPKKDKASFESWRRIVHSEDLSIAERRIEKALNDKEFLNSDYRIILPDGRIRWINAVGKGQYNEQGQPNRMTGVCIDITERKSAEHKLQVSEERYRVLFEMESDALFVVENETGNILDANAAAVFLYGYSLEELLAMRNVDLSAQPDETRKATVSGATKIPIRYHRKKDGTVFPVEITAAVLNIEGRSVHIPAIRDITERMEIEEKLINYQRRLSDIIEFLPDATLVIDIEGKVIAWNKAIEKMTGIKAEEMLGKGDFEYSIPFYGERKQILIDLALRGDQEKEKQYTTLNKSGDVIFGEAYTPNLAPGNVHLSATASVLRDSEGKVVGAIECIRNSTERKNMEDRLKRAEKMESLGLLAGGVAHDLNNALGILVGYSELLYEGLKEDDPLREDARNIITGGEHAAAIVQDLLTLARRGVQTKAVCNINKIITECMKSPEYLKLTSFHPDIRMKTELEEELLQIKGSKVHLSKTIINLLSNAAEAMTSGGEMVIRTENRYLDRPVLGYDELHEGDYVVLSVSDEGEGISEDDLKHIFEPFYTKKVMGISGTGLGLSVVWGTVKDHDGYIDVQSRRGQGTTFSLYFPVTQDEMQEAKTVHIDEYLGRGEKILVVDDVKNQRELANRILSKLNYHVNTVASGEEAVEYLKTNEVDLIVLDMIMEPGIDGFETYRQISEFTPQQKAVIVSGFAETERVKMAQSLGAGAFVKKPYIRERIGLAVRKELDKK